MTDEYHRGPSTAELKKLQRLRQLKGELERRDLEKHKSGYIDFVTTILKVPLTPAQRVLGAVCFDGVDPENMSAEDQVLAEKLFGPVKRFPAETRNAVFAVAGARAGKTYLFSLRLLHLALTVDLSTLAPGEQPLGVVVAPSLKIAEQGMRYIIGALNSVPALRSMAVDKMTPMKVRIKRGDEIVAIEPRAASSKGVSTRGFSIIGAMIDEVAFLRDEDSSIPDTEIYNSIFVRMLPGAQMLCPSTPWIQRGLLYNRFKENFGHPITAVVAHCPTLVLLDTPRNRFAIDNARRDDPERAIREYDAEFVSGAVEQFFEPAWIDRSIDNNLLIPRDPQPGDVTKAGADFAFEGDSSAFVAVHSRGGVHMVADILEKRPSSGEPLRPSEVVADFARRCEENHTPWVCADAHYRQAIQEYLTEYGLFLVDAPSAPEEAFVTTRILLHQGLIRLPRHPRLLAQMREVQARRTPGGKISILLPRHKAGGVSVGHCDIVSALVLAVHQACGGMIPEAEPDPDSPEGRQLLNQRMMEARRQERMSDYNERTGPWYKVPPGQRIRVR